MNWNEILLLSSVQNADFRSWLRLKNGKAEKKSCDLLCEGLRQIETCLLDDSLQGTLLFADDERGEGHYWRLREILSERSGISLRRLSTHLFDQLSETCHHQGILLICRMPDIVSPLKAFPDTARLLIVDAVQDPGNLGTMIRTAEAMGFTAMVLMPGTVWPYNPKVLRAAMGSLFFLPIYQIRHASELKLFLKTPLLIADLEGEDIALTATRLKANGCRGYALAVGNEGNGLSRELREVSDYCFTIPMQGNAESLNVTAAFAISAYVLGSLGVDS